MVNGSSMSETPAPACNAAGRVDDIQRRLDFVRAHFARDQRRQISAPVAHHHHLIAPGSSCRILSSIGSGAMLCPDPRIIRFLMRPTIFQFPRCVDFALIAGVKPAVAQHFRRLLGTVPISRKNIRPAHHDLLHSPRASSRLPKSPAQRGPEPRAHPDHPWCRSPSSR